MDIFNDKISGMKWGFRFSQFASIIGFILTLGLFFFVSKEKKDLNSISKNTTTEKKRLKDEEVQTDNSFEKF
jgi:hypothetical protein